MGIGSTFTRESLIAESENMSTLGAGHIDNRHWAELELPLANFMLSARAVLRKWVCDVSLLFF